MVIRKKHILLFSMKYILLLFSLLSSITLSNISSENMTISNVPVPNKPQINPSCTIFTISRGDKVFYGNNEDWRPEYLSKLGLWYIPSQRISVIGGERSIYGGVYIGFREEEKGELYLNPCGGMNEHGLIFDINGLPSNKLIDNPNGSSFWTNGVCYFSTILWDCKNVEEVIEYYKMYKWDTTIGGQIHYADASGDAVVISVDPITHTWAFTRKNGNFIISTNFNLNYTKNAYNYPCARYNTATQMLNEIESEEDLTVQACADILYAVHMEGSCTTLFSNIFDPVNLDLYLNYGENYQKQKKVNLLEVLSQNDPLEFDMFNIRYMTGVDDYMLVKSVRIDENFYSSSKNLLFLTVSVVIIAVCIIGIALRVFLYKRKVE